MTPPTKAKSIVIPAAIAAVVIGGAIAAYLFASRTPAPAPAPVAAVAPAKPEAVPAPAVDAEKIRRETEERLRKEFAEKAVAERAAMEKSVAEKLAAERAAAEKVMQAKTASEKAAAEKVAATAVAARVAAEKAAAEKAAAERANAEKAAAERAAADKAVAEKAAAEKVAAERAAAEKAAAEKLAAAKPAADSHEAKLQRFIQRVGRDKVLRQEPPAFISAFVPGLRYGEVVYVDDGSCGSGRIREVTGVTTSTFGNAPRPSRCISLDEGGSVAARPPAAKPVAPSPAAAPGGALDADAQLERFIQRKGRDKILKQEPPITMGATCATMVYQCGSVMFVNDNSCGPGAIKEIIIENPLRNADRSYRCISLADDKPMAARPGAARPAAAPAAAAPGGALDADAQLERFIQRKGRDKVLKEEPPLGSILPGGGGLASGEVVYVNDGSCPPGRIREVTGSSASGTNLRGRPSRCISLAD